MINRQIIFLSSAALILGAILWRWGNRMLREGVRTNATIICNRHEPSTDGEGDGVYVVKELDIGSPVKKEVGTELNVVYDPENPSDFVTSPTLWLKIVPRLLVGGGVVGIAVAVMDLLEVISVVPD